MIIRIKRLSQEWYRLDHPDSSHYADLQKADALFWQGSIRAKGSNAEVSHTETFRRLTDVREVVEHLVQQANAKGKEE